MYFIVETKEQFDKLPIEDTCFVNVIQSNDNMHPELSRASLVYYRTDDKGYIFPINHSEGFSLDIQYVNSFLSKHKAVYVIDQKRHSYYLSLNNIIDIAFTQLDKDGHFEQVDCSTPAHRTLNNRLRDELSINEIIPIAKHYESCECYYDSIKNYIGLEQDDTSYSRISEAYKQVESSGIKVDLDLFQQKYPTANKDLFIKDSIAYNYYNIYNVTGRPTNAFAGVNFLAIPKEKQYRDCFIASNDALVEFDFDAYHLRLIAQIIGYEFPSGESSIHYYMAKQYFGKDDITDEEYKEAKTISFKQLYGGIDPKYKSIEFLSKIDAFIESEWLKYKRDQCYILPTKRMLRYDKQMNKLKLFNYIIQNQETKQNLDKIEAILQLIKQNNYKTKLILITYDSLLFDYSIQDGKQAIINIKAILQDGGFIVKHKYGKTYSFGA